MVGGIQSLAAVGSGNRTVSHAGKIPPFKRKSNDHGAARLELRGFSWRGCFTGTENREARQFLSRYGLLFPLIAYRPPRPSGGVSV